LIIMKKLILLGIIAVVALAGIFIIVKGFPDIRGNGGERMPAEGSLSITNPVAINYQQSPAEYGLQTNHEYVLRYTAQVFTSNTNGTMSIKIVLPSEFQIISGETEWEGNDKQKTIEIRFKPAKAGNYTIRGNTTNLDDKFSSVTYHTIYVRDTVEEAVNVTERPVSNIIPISVVKDANNTP